MRKWLSFVPSSSRNPYHQVLRGAEHNAKGLEAIEPIVAEIFRSIISKHIFSWESGFLVFLVLQKSLQVSFKGCLNTMTKVWKL